MFSPSAKEQEKQLGIDNLTQAISAMNAAQVSEADLAELERSGSPEAVALARQIRAQLEQDKANLEQEQIERINLRNELLRKRFLNNI